MGSPAIRAQWLVADGDDRRLRCPGRRRLRRRHDRREPAQESLGRRQETQAEHAHGTEIKESKLGKVPSARRADTLDGIDSTAFTRGACGINNGAIHGYARIVANSGFSTTFTTAGVESPYNCSGQTVEARRIALGFYEVRFNGTDPGLVVATNMQLSSLSPSDMNVSLSRTSNNTYVATDADLAGTSTDWPFVIVLL